MYIRVTKSPTSKFSKVYLVEGYRDENGKVKQRIIKSYGNLEELQKEDPNILEKLKEEAKKIPSNIVDIPVDLKDTNLSMEKDKNYGYFFLEKIYYELEIPKFIMSFQTNSKEEYDLNEILKLLVYGRILNPMSKKATFEQQETYFEPFKVTLPSIYASLSQFHKIKQDIQYHLHQKVNALYNRDVSLVFYDVTNYYFETDHEDDLKKKGISKENKKSPIIQMGLLIDRNGLPIAYQLFPGNTHDSRTLEPFIEKLRKGFNLGRIILTADKGLNSKENLAYLSMKKDGYIVSQKVRGTSKEFIAKVLDEEGYVYNKSKTFKVKSFIRKRKVERENKSEITLEEKVVCFWSKNFDVYEKKKREKLEERIIEFMETPSKYNASNRYGIKKYLKLQHIDKKTGEIEKIKPILEFDREKYERDVALDGYYVLVTSELELSEIDIIEKYRGLWKIEESFKVLKSDLEGRPVYVRRNDYIEGHFLVCFLALLFIRIIELKLNHKYSTRRIQEALKEAKCRKLNKGIYSLNKQDEVYREIEKVFNVNLNYRYVRLEQIRLYRRDIIHNNKN